MDLATLEGEALLLGIWKNTEELEECLNLNELELIVKSAREKEHRRNKFTAAMKGINIDEVEMEDAKERFDMVKRRVEAKKSGKSEMQLELDELGIDVEIE